MISSHSFSLGNVQMVKLPLANFNVPISSGASDVMVVAQLAPVHHPSP